MGIEPSPPPREVRRIRLAKNGTWAIDKDAGRSGAPLEHTFLEDTENETKQSLTPDIKTGELLRDVIDLPREAPDRGRAGGRRIGPPKGNRGTAFRRKWERIQPRTQYICSSRHESRFVRIGYSINYGINVCH